MQDKELRAALRKIGLKVDRQGRTNAKNGTFCILNDGLARFPDGRSVAISDVTDVSYTDIGVDSKLEFTMANGMVTETGLGRFNEDGVGEPLPERPMPRSVSELNDVIKELYPELYDYMYYDVLSECVYIDMSYFGRPDIGLIRQDDASMVIISDDLERKLKAAGFVGTFPSDTVREQAFATMKYDNPRNRFRERVESLKWDGVPRLRTWFQDTFGATVPALQSIGMEDKYLGDVAEAWFIGGIRRMYTKCRHEIIPVLISGQGIGKGHAICYTALADEFYRVTTADMADPAAFLDTTRGGVIVELGESRQMKVGAHEIVKAFISKDCDQYRKPYARREEVFDRHFIMIATSNSDTIFTDVTGERRFFPMYLDVHRATREFSIDRRVGQYDVEQVWAEALELYRQGHTWFMTSESADLAKMVQKYAQTENTGVDAINEWLDANKPNVGDKTCRREILYNVFNVSASTVPKDVTAAFNAWSISADNPWMKHGSVRIPGFGGGMPQKGYIRKYAVGECVKFETLKIVSGDRAERSDDAAETAEALIRRLAIEQGFREFGDAVDVSALSKQELDGIFFEGYVYEGGYADGKMTYRLGYLP